MKDLVCSHCGATEFTKLPNGNLKCNYCGTEYIQSPTPEEKATENAQTYRDVHITGMDHSGSKFIVHKKLKVSGMDNIITRYTSLENAEHVGTLKISGMDHHIDVVLVDGATYSCSGMDNKLRNF